MSARQRGATLVLALLLLGRSIDVFDLPFERRIPIEFVPPDSLPAPAAPAPPAPPDSAAAPAPAVPLAINTATLQELQTLPGVGPVLAQRILDFRAANGVFRGPQDLRRVKGIGGRTAERLAPLVRFD